MADIPGIPPPVEDALLKLHRAVSVLPMAEAVLELIESSISLAAVSVVLRPMEPDRSLLLCNPSAKAAFEGWIAAGHDEDIWLQRRPPRPGDTVVRHTDHTPDAVLVRSPFYEQRMKPNNFRYGAALVIWRESQCRAVIMMVRSSRQGDFADGELAWLRRLHRHIETAVHRVAELEEERNAHRSLSAFMEGLPVALLLLSANFELLFHNRAGREFCDCWRNGPVRAGAVNPPRRFSLPPDLLNAVRESFPPGSSRADRVRKARLTNQRFPSLVCHATRVPPEPASWGGATFLLRFTNGVGDRDSPPDHHWKSLRELTELTPAEREVAQLLVGGMTNRQIAFTLGKSPATVRNQLHSIFRKLNVSRREELMARLLTCSGAAGSAGTSELIDT